MRKPAFCICENKGADQRLSFRYIDSTILRAFKYNKKSYYMFKHVIIGGVMKLVGKEASKN